MKTTGPGQSSLLLLDVINILDRPKIPYAVIGAFAASFYGIVRASMDADAIVSFRGDPLCLKAVLSEIENTGFDVAQSQGDIDDPIAGVISVTDRHHNRVDLLTGIRGMPSDLFTRVVTADFSGAQIQMIGVEDFIAMKVFAGSPKDIDDVRGVLKVSSEAINYQLLRDLTSGYGKNELKILEKILKGDDSNE